LKYETILFKSISGVAYLTFNRPEVQNAINMKMIDEIEEIIEYIEKSSQIDLLLISGTGESFCAGADTTEFLNMTIEENQYFLERFSKMTKRIQDLSIPVIGKINGFAFGGGAEIATSCDFRIASNQASFRFPGVSYGLVVTSSNLPIIVGVPKAKELLFRSCIISADEAYRIGLVDQLIKVEEFEQYTEKVVKEIQSNSIIAVKKAKETINNGVGEGIDIRLELEKKANHFLVHHTNYRDTFNNFVEKRKSKVKNNH
jgi:enoyl-CoA hydratase/carnithine racemase